MEIVNQKNILPTNRPMLPLLATAPTRTSLSDVFIVALTKTSFYNSKFRRDCFRYGGICLIMRSIVISERNVVSCSLRTKVIYLRLLWKL